MKDCSNPECHQPAELVLDGGQRVVNSLSVSLADNASNPKKVKVLINTHKRAEFCYFHNKRKEKLIS